MSWNLILSYPKQGAVLAVFFERELFINYVRRYMKVAEKVVGVKSFS